MKVEFTTSGGVGYFPGLAKPVTIDGDALPEAEARALARLVEAADFFDRPASLGGPPPGAADMQVYTITVEDGGRRHSLRLAGPVEDSALQDLLAFLRTKAKELRARRRGAP